MSAILNTPAPSFNWHNRLQRENRQPTHPADFVLIDPYNFAQYANMQRLYDKLPTGLPLAKNKAEKANKYSHKSLVAEYSHFTPNINKKFIHCLVFDLDDHLQQFNFIQWSEVGLPPPNIIITNPSKPNSCQYVYLLEYPVFVQKNPSVKAWLDDIYRVMRELLNADKFFNRTRSKNPFSPLHDVFVSGAEPYTLTDLADKAFLIDCDINNPTTYINPFKTTAPTATPQSKQITLDLPIQAVNDPSLYSGRNDETFHKIRWVGYPNAYRSDDDLFNLLLNACIQYQKRFDTPLDVRECEYIARSITKFCKEQYRQNDFIKDGNYSEQAKQNFCNKQRNRAYRRWKGYKDKRKTALEMLKNGMKQADICKELEIGKMTLHRWKKDSIIK